MESNEEEALRSKAIAERHFVQKDFVSARNYGVKAQMLCPELDGLSQMVATFGVYIASESKMNGELDFYSILGLDPMADKSKLKRQYKKMAILLHPDKNKTVGADGAFRLISEAWTLLSDSYKRASYDQRRNFFAGYSAGGGVYENFSKVSSSHGSLDSFWTVCTSCHVQYEYLRKYVNKRLSCKNCRGVFIAVETGLAPVNGSFPYSTYSSVPENGYSRHVSGVTYIPPNGASGHHTGYRSEYVSNISFQGTSSGKSVGVLDPNGLSKSSFVFYQANGEANKSKANGKHQTVNATVHNTEVSKSKRGRPAKKRKLDLAGTYTNGLKEISPVISVEAKVTNGNGNLKPVSKLSSPCDTSSRRCPPAPLFDTRQFLIDKARSEIRKKLEEMSLASQAEASNLTEASKVLNSTGSGHRSELKKTVSMSITVPDSDFHDFDRDRSEECFKPKQIWSLYDEEDGMPRLYCLIREILSLNPFRIYISYLSSKTDTEFGSVNWLDSGFTKSCGSFRVFHSEMVDQVDIFSHLLGREKAGRGGCVRIYPRSGDIWAVYRNWSPDWNRTTPDEVRHQYEMVEVLDDYREDHGVWVNPLVKLDGFKTVYQRNKDKDTIRYIPRREMVRFSHQVPSRNLKDEGTRLPEGCWDLDPAATPDELLQGENDSQKIAETLNGQFPVESEGFNRSGNFASTPDMEERIPVQHPQEKYMIKTVAELPHPETTAKA